MLRERFGPSPASVPVIDVKLAPLEPTTNWRLSTSVEPTSGLEAAA